MTLASTFLLLSLVLRNVEGQGESVQMVQIRC